jgi:hypothetical protein
MAWRLARSLSTLRSEILAKHPGTTVWTIGDTSHQSGYSDHNPNADRVVCAIDVKGDKGLNLSAFVAHLIAFPHPNLRYVIYNRKIYQRRNGFAAQDYNGANAHRDHVHVSVGNGPDGRSTTNYDNTSSWGLVNLGTPKPSNPTSPSKPTAPKPSTSDWTQELIMSLPTLRRGSEGGSVKRLQGLLHAAGQRDSAIDGDFGPGTERAVKDFQRAKKLGVDGIVGRNTWTKLIKG